MSPLQEEACRQAYLGTGLGLHILCVTAVPLQEGEDELGADSAQVRSGGNARF